MKFCAYLEKQEVCSRQSLLLETLRTRTDIKANCIELFCLAYAINQGTDTNCLYPKTDWNPTYISGNSWAKIQQILESRFDENDTFQMKVKHIDGSTSDWIDVEHLLKNEDAKLLAKCFCLRSADQRTRKDGMTMINGKMSSELANHKLLKIMENLK
jgi:hypothetical protein